MIILDGSQVLAEVQTLFIETGAGRLGLATWKASSSIPGGKRLIFKTADDRLATVDVSQEHNVVHVHFSIEEKKDSEALGVSLAARPGERFVGLLDRVVDGAAEDSWRPGMKEALDLRGQRIEMMVRPGASLYEPFFLSSAGYGVLVEGSWPGYYDLAASHRDEVFFQFEGPALALDLIPGPDPARILAVAQRLVGPPLLPPKWVFDNWGTSPEVVPPEVQDFSQPSAVSRLQDVLKSLLGRGARALGIEMNVSRVPTELSVKMHDGRTARESYNDYSRLYLQAAFQTSAPAGQDFVLAARTGYSGSQKFAVFRGGDLPATAEGLRAAIIAVQRAAVMGFPYWGSQSGGFSQSDSEMAARWIAFSAFTPIFQPSTSSDAGRFYAGLHHRLMDYSYQAALQGHKTGLPLVRPLFVAAPKDSQVWNFWQEFMYGDDLLVGAIWQKGQRSFSMYLPAGKWIDAWDGRNYTGPATVNVDCPVYKIPIFLRRGSKAPVADLQKEWE